MKIKSIPSKWIHDEGLRLDSNPYMSGAVESKLILQNISVNKQKLQELTKDGIGGIYHAGRESRQWVKDPAHGIPFMSSRDVMTGDLSHLPLLSKKQVLNNSRFLVEQDWILITRSGTIGRTVYAHSAMNGLACSEHVMRVVPDRNLVYPGYVYAFLKSRYGVSLVVSGTYGSIIQSIEPEHLAKIPIPRFEKELEQKIHSLISKASSLRDEYQELIVRSSQTFLKACKLEDIDANDWDLLGSELGFPAKISTALSLRAFNYSIRVVSFIEKIKNNEYAMLGDICSDGLLNTGKRFKRIDCDPEYGVRLVGQKQGFWLRPEGRWISPDFAPPDIFAKSETVLIASSGTLGENEVYCRPILVYGNWTDYAYTQHFLRILPGESSSVSGAYLFAFLRTNIAFRILRSMSTGSKQQEVHRSLIAKFPIPLIPQEHVKSVEQDVRRAFACRDEADALEDQAIALVEKAIKEAV